MKGNKFLVHLLNEDGSTKETKEFKSYKEITENLNIEYFLVRDINQITEGIKSKKFYHNNLSQLLKKIKIETIKPTITLEFLENKKI